MDHVFVHLSQQLLCHLQRYDPGRVRAVPGGESRLSLQAQSSEEEAATPDTAW